jgi:putative cell wall-binding protein
MGKSRHIPGAEEALRVRPTVKQLSRLSVAAVAGLTATVGLALAASVPAANATSSVSLTTIAGPTRYDTSADIAEAKYPSGVTSGNVVLATGSNFPDALAGNYLAGQLGAPILLSPISISDPNYAAVTVPALAKLLPGTTKNITILGGTFAIGADVASDLQSKGYTVTRIAGATRYDTAQLIDTVAGQTPGNGVSGNKTAIVATGANFPDALAAGPLAWAKHFPVILTDGTQSTLLSQATAALTADGIKNVILMGGSAALNAGINTALTGMGITIDKQFSGVDRTDTAAQAATYEIATYGFSNAKVILASGANFPDALSGGPLGGDPQPIVLTEPDNTMLGSTTAFLSGESATLSAITVLGGTFAVPTATATAAQTAAEQTPKAQTSLPQLVGASIISTTISGQQSATVGLGTVVEFDFSQPLAAATFVAGNFKVWPSSDVPGAYTGSGVCNGGSTTPTNCTAATGANSVRVLFSALNTTALASSLTLATVASGAVTLSSGAVNPDGAVAIGSGGTTSLSPNVTNAPDLTAVGAPRAASGPGTSAIDLTFDKAATPANGANANYYIVYAAGQGNNSPVETLCTGPTTATAATTTTGLTVPGYDLGNSTVTIVCPNAPVNSVPTLTSAQIGWIVIKPGTVNSASFTTPTTNQFIEASPTQLAATPIVRLTGVTLTPGTSFDQAVFTFDQPVTAATITPSLLGLVPANGGTPINNGGAIASCTTTAATAAGQCQVPSSVPTSVDVFFPANTIAGSAIVGAQAATGAVVASNAPNLTNADDELGTPNSSTTTTSSGVINAVQLLSASAVAGVNGLNQPTETATWTFDFTLQAITLNGTFHVYDADGTELTCANANATIPSGAQATVVCTTFVQGSSGTGTAATAAQMSGITLATVDTGAVKGGNATAPTTSSTNPNPEGAAGA